MHVRPLRHDEREPLLDLLDGWEQADGWRARDFFARYFDEDPTPEENFVVAEKAGRLVSCVQIFPQHIRVAGVSVSMGGIGTVYTAPAARGAGVASDVLRAVLDNLRARGVRISLLYATRTAFYGRVGWESWPMTRWLLRRSETADARTVAPRGSTTEAFDPARDLAVVRDIHASYDRTRDGTTIRDAAAWSSSLRVAGNPREEIVVTRRHGVVAAYLRVIAMRGVLVISEFGRRDDGAEALAALMDDQLSTRDDDPFATPARDSRELRQFAVVTSAHDSELEAALAARGLSVASTSDTSMMFQCIDPQGLAGDLGIALLPAETPNAFLRRVLPPERLVVWPADRF